MVRVERRRNCAPLLRVRNAGQDDAPSEARTYVTKHGTTATMNTENIGTTCWPLNFLCLTAFDAY